MRGARNAPAPEPAQDKDPVDLLIWDWTYPFIETAAEFQQALRDLHHVPVAVQADRLGKLAETVMELPGPDRGQACGAVLAMVRDLPSAQQARPLDTLAMALPHVPPTDRAVLFGQMIALLRNVPCSVATRPLLALATQLGPTQDKVPDMPGSDDASVASSGRRSRSSDSISSLASSLNSMRSIDLNDAGGWMVGSLFEALPKLEETPAVSLAGQVIVRIRQLSGVRDAARPALVADLIRAAALIGVHQPVPMGQLTGFYDQLPVADRLSVLVRVGGSLSSLPEQRPLTEWLSNAVAREIAQTPATQGADAHGVLLSNLLLTVEAPGADQARQHVAGWVAGFTADQVADTLPALPAMLARLSRPGRETALDWIIGALKRHTTQSEGKAPACHTPQIEALGQAISQLPATHHDRFMARAWACFDMLPWQERQVVQNGLAAGLRRGVPDPSEAALRQFRRDMLGWGDLVSRRTIVKALRELAPQDLEEAKIMLIAYSRSMLFNQAVRVVLAAWPLLLF